MRKHSSERGQVAIFVVLSLTLMLATLGMVTDLGWSYYRKQAAQAAAQAAAMAAVQAALTNSGGSISCTATGVSCQSATPCPTTISSPPSNNLQNGCLYAKDNGFVVTTGGKQNVTMEANTGAPPTTSGLNALYYVTARVSENVPQSFSAVLGNTQSTVSARATAAVLSNSTNCIYIMDPTASGALNMSGTPGLVSSCGIYINSNSGSALTGNGTPNLSASSIEIVGGNGGFGGTLSPTPTTGVSPAPDPLSYVQAPDLSSMSVRSATSFSIAGWSVTILQPGIYRGGISVVNGTAIFSPGTYVIEGGGLSTQNANSIITGAGVTIYNTCSNTPGNCGSTSDYGPINIKATSTVTLTAPTAGSYAGMLFMEDRSIPRGQYSDTFGGGSTAVYTGAVYAPLSNVTFYGNSALSAYTILVCNQISMVGTTNINNNYATLPTGNPLKSMALVE